MELENKVHRNSALAVAESLYEVLTLDEFALANQYLIGKVSGRKVTDKFVLWNLKTNNVHFYEKSGIEQIMKVNNIETELKDFFDLYQEYWGGWRFWLMA